MTTSGIRGFAVRRAGGPLERTELGPVPLRDGQVEVAVTHCGVCHSDVHLIDGDWGDVFPLVPGHEIIGTVVAGTGFPVGTRVGIGWQCGSCGRCEFCAGGNEQFCPSKERTCVKHNGGFAERVTVDARFAIPVPDGLESAACAPLFCAGITVWSPLRRFAQRGSSVAVLGIGGLGHLALQFARALGCEVTAITRTRDKGDDAVELGAHHVVVGAPPRRAFDLVLNTAPFTPEMSTWLRALRPRGVFCQLASAPSPLSIDSIHLINGDRSIAGSDIGSPGGISEMLSFAAQHGVCARVEEVPMEEVNRAVDRTRRGAARYRMVLRT